MEIDVSPTSLLFPHYTTDLTISNQQLPSRFQVATPGKDRGGPLVGSFTGCCASLALYVASWRGRTYSHGDVGPFAARLIPPTLRLPLQVAGVGFEPTWEGV